MSKRIQRIWTDEEMGYIESTMDRPSKQVAADLGRTQRDVLGARYRLRQGWQGKQHWTAAEDALIMESKYRTAPELARLLPGRTEGAVKKRRGVLGAPNVQRSAKDPFSPAGRPLIAKTCQGCGLLLPAEWFTYSRGVKISQCRKCRSGQKASDYANNPDPYKARAKKQQTSGYELRAQIITSQLAERSGEEYTEADHKVLADPTLTRLRKALQLKRTYRAVSLQIHKSGYKSFKGVGDPEKDQWLIDNPNADRIEEITAMLGQPEPATPTRPDFEWDD